MADLTFADYASETLGYMNENRDTSKPNRKFPIDDVKKAINRGRNRMLRKVGLGLYRAQTVQDAVAGDITPPTDFFKAGILRFTPSGGSTMNLEQTTAQYMDQTNPNWRSAPTGTPSKFVWDIQAIAPVSPATLYTAGIVARLYPQPASTVTNGLTWTYSAKLNDLVEDTDTCPIMNLFPEFQMTTLQAGALRLLYLLEGGEADDQFAKWDGIFDKDIAEMRGSINTLFIAPGQVLGRNG
jgi:hypothetical protein